MRHWQLNSFPKHSIARRADSGGGVRGRRGVWAATFTDRGLNSFSVLARLGRFQLLDSDIGLGPFAFGLQRRILGHSNSVILRDAQIPRLGHGPRRILARQMGGLPKATSPAGNDDVQQIAGLTLVEHGVPAWEAGGLQLAGQRGRRVRIDSL
jgi:hypothetical protein